MCHPCPLQGSLPSLGRMQTVEGLQLSAPSGFASAAAEQPPARSHPSWGDLSWARLGSKAQNSPDCLRLCLACITFVFSLLLNLIPLSLLFTSIDLNKHLASQTPSPSYVSSTAGRFPQESRLTQVAAKSWIIHHLAGLEWESPLLVAGGAQRTLQGS